MPLTPSHRGCVHKAARKVCVSRLKVLHVLHTVMATNTTPDTSDGAGAAVDSTNDFYSTGRVGRRNAMPDILSQQHSHTSTADLHSQLGALSTKDDDGAGCSSSTTTTNGNATTTSAASGASSTSSGSCSTTTHADGTSKS